MMICGRMLWFFFSLVREFNLSTIENIERAYVTTNQPYKNDHHMYIFDGEGASLVRTL